MANADRCYLNIPWKEWAKQLTKALEGVEGVDVELLKKMGEQDFDNHKAIERRVNDGSCTPEGGATDAMFLIGTGSQTATGGAATVYTGWGTGSGVNSRVKRVGDAFNWAYTSGTGEVTVPSGLYLITGGLTWVATTDVGHYTCRCKNNVTFGSAATQNTMRTDLIEDTIYNSGVAHQRPSAFSGALMSTASFNVSLEFETTTGTNRNAVPFHMEIVRLGDFYADA